MGLCDVSGKAGGVIPLRLFIEEKKQLHNEFEEVCNGEGYGDFNF